MGGGLGGPWTGHPEVGRLRATPDKARRTGDRVDGSIGVASLVAVAVVALLAPLVVGLLPWLRLPQVVLLLAGGILIGPHVLGLGTSGDVQVLADVGVGFAFLLAGYEVDLRLFGQDAGRRAVAAWLASVVLALGVVGVPAAVGSSVRSCRSPWG